MRVSAEHPAMAPLSFVLDGVIGGEAEQAAASAQQQAEVLKAVETATATLALATKAVAKLEVGLKAVGLAMADCLQSMGRRGGAAQGDRNQAARG